MCFPSNAALRFLAYDIFSKRKLECDYFCVILFTFLFMTQKLYSILLPGTEEILIIYFGTCRAFCVLCQLMSYMYVSLFIAWDYSAVQLYLTVLPKNDLCTLPFVLVNGVSESLV